MNQTQFLEHLTSKQLLLTLLLISLTTVVINWATRSAIRLFIRKQRAPELDALLAPLNRFILLLGLQALIDAFPLRGKVLLWSERTLFILISISLAFLSHRALTLGLAIFARRTRSSEVLQKGFFPIIRNLITLFVLASATIAILKKLDYDVMSLLAALGVGSLAVGLAAKDTLSNMISGFTLLMDRNLIPGDRIQLAGNGGIVEQIGLRSTRIRTPQGSTLIVPNSELVNTRILNLSQPSEKFAVSVPIRVPPLCAFSSVEPLAAKILDEEGLVLKSEPRAIRFAALTETHLLLTAHFWISTSEQEQQAISNFNRRLMDELVRAEIEFVTKRPT
jgi:MscS family membrane protein